MSDTIGRELQFLGASFIWGLLLMSGYDILRILRKIIPHPFLLTAVEDMIYWLIGGLLVFRMIYARNDGIIRGYFVVALLVGMLLYYSVVGEKVVRFIAGIWYKIRDAIKKVLLFITRPFRFIWRRSYKNIKILLKSIKKTITIALKKQ